MSLVPGTLRRNALEEALSHYEDALTRDAGAKEYLRARGIGAIAALHHRVGFCCDPAPGHEQLKGRLIVPYLDRQRRPSALKARCIQSHDCKEAECVKYLGTDGDEPRLYNVADLFVDSPFLVVTEGEIDAMTISTVVGAPCVGYPGVSAWRGYMTRAIGPDYDRVIVVADGDKPGRSAAKEVAKKLSGEVAYLPDGEDANSVVVRYGAGVLLDHLGLTPDDLAVPF